MAQPRMELDAPINVTAEFDPPMVSTNQQAVLRISFNAMEDTISWPEKLPVPANLGWRPGAHGQVMQMNGTNMSAKTTFLYHARPSAPGEYVLPAFDVEVMGKAVKVPETRLLAITGQGPPPKVERLQLELPATNFFLGQAFRPRMSLPFTYARLVTLAQVQVSGQGFLSEPGATRQRIEPIPRFGSNQVTFVYEPLLTPISAGKQSIFAQAWAYGNRPLRITTVSNQTLLNFVVEETLVDSEPLEVMVQPLPKAGELPGFTGAVGNFTNDPPKLSAKSVLAGEPLKMRITFRGDGNLARLVPPPAPQSKEWQVFEASGDPNPPNVIQAQGMVTFTYTLIPLTPQVRATPPIHFSYFNPAKAKYMNLTIAPVSVRVLPSDHAADLAAFEEADKLNESTSNNEAALTGLAAVPGVTTASLAPVQSRPWFRIVQVTPAICFLGLWLWDKRRRFLEANPHIVRQHAARRALRKHRRALNRAAGHGDSAEYARLGVAAMCAVAAPHYPAEPGALVGADVLALLDIEERNGTEGDLIRRFFVTADEKRFSGLPPIRDGVLDLRPRFEKLLSSLETRFLPDRGFYWSKDYLRANPDRIRQNHARKAARSFAALLVGLCYVSPCAHAAETAGAQELFSAGTNAYSRSDFPAAAAAFTRSAAAQPASGTLQNLGLAEWRSGRIGLAVLSWERALWVDQFNRQARENLRFARKTAQLDSPELTWYEVVSTWLPVNSWAWITGCSMWLAIAMVLVPNIARQRKTTWHQAIAAFALMFFLLSLPAQLGVHTRTRIGFVVGKDTQLRLTPTADAQILARLAAGEPARFERKRGKYVLVRTNRFAGWLEAKEVGLVCPM